MSSVLFCSGNIQENLVLTKNRHFAKNVITFRVYLLDGNETETML